MHQRSRELISYINYSTCISIVHYDMYSTIYLLHCHDHFSIYSSVYLLHSMTHSLYFYDSLHCRIADLLIQWIVFTWFHYLWQFGYIGCCRITWILTDSVDLNGGKNLKNLKSLFRKLIYNFARKPYAIQTFIVLKRSQGWLQSFFRAPIHINCGLFSRLPCRQDLTTWERSSLR